MSAEGQTGSPIKVAGIALRTAEGGPMREAGEANAEVDGGLIGDVPKKERKRGITFLSAGQWREVTGELGAAELPWHTRRANVLLDGCGSLADLIGKRIKIGNGIELEIGGETLPCGLMDQLHSGLKNTLVPDCRAGVYGRVLTDGTIRIGDQVEILD